MSSLMVMAQLAGAVALLLFGLRLVRDGMTDAFGFRVKVALGLGTRTGPRAFISGVIATLGLQSSTATALMTAGFAERDMIRGRAAQIVLLGANVGTAMTAWIVASGIEAVAPALLLIGYILFRQEDRTVLAGSGRALIGIGLMLLSLTMLSQATEPLRNAPAMGAFLTMLDGALPVAFLIAAGIAVICSSSLAAVLLILSLNLDPALTVALVLGANLGGAIPPVLATMLGSVAARRLTVGNLLVRAIGCVLALPFAAEIGAALGRLPLHTGLAVEAHLAFNIVLAALIWPFAGAIAGLAERLLTDEDAAKDAEPRWLDEDALGTPTLALAGASREALAIGDSIERMLTQLRVAFDQNDTAPLAEIEALEERVDKRQQQVKFYLSRLRGETGPEDKRRSIIILDYVINLEHIGDIIDKNLVPAVRKKAGMGLWLSDEGYSELDQMFLLTLENLRIAQTVFMTRDRDLARQLIEAKVVIRKLEHQSTQRHLLRLREGKEEARQTSSLHLDMLRDLKRVNAHMVAVAHPILDEEGMLVESRLRAG